MKLIDLENEFDADIDRLVDLKIEINRVIKTVNDTDCELLLELRYLNFKTEEQIATIMGFTFQWIHSLDKKALQKK